MKMLNLVVGPMETNCYILYEDGKCLIIDPGDEENSIIKEIPMDKIKLVVDEIGIIIKNSQAHKDMVFDLDNVKKFINMCVEIIYSDIIKYI